MAKPYIGVSGVRDSEQAQDVSELAQGHSLESHRDLLFGVKATHKTLMLNRENKYGRGWYPLGSDLASAFSEPVAGQLVAQVFMEEPQEELYRQEFTDRLTEALPQLTGLQFDMLPWHEEDLRHYFHQLRCRGYGLYLQVFGSILDEGPEEAWRLFNPYEGLVTNLLFDASHGTGRPMEADRLSRFLDYFAGRTTARLGVAGGLGPQMEVVAPLLDVYPGLSWDAEGKLHPKDGGDGELSLEAVDAYFQASSLLF